MHSWIFFERPVPRDFTVYCGENYMRIKHQMGLKIPFLHSPHSQIMTPRYTGKKISKIPKNFENFSKNFQKISEKIPKNVQKIFDVWKLELVWFLTNAPRVHTSEVHCCCPSIKLTTLHLNCMYQKQFRKFYLLQSSLSKMGELPFVLFFF